MLRLEQLDGEAPSLENVGEADMVSSDLGCLEPTGLVKVMGQLMYVCSCGMAELLLRSLARNA